MLTKEQFRKNRYLIKDKEGNIVGKFRYKDYSAQAISVLVRRGFERNEIKIEKIRNG